ncbi:MAG: hypothetical protein R3C01_08130 [Planctomycetaceae bacterium]
MSGEISGDQFRVLQQSGGCVMWQSMARRVLNRLASYGVLGLLIGFHGFGGALSPPAIGADDATTAIVIAKEPRFVDPTPFYPKPLQKKVTKTFESVSLRKVFDWLSQETGMTVIPDTINLEMSGIDFENETWTDDLQKEPVYILLARLEELRVGWFVRNGLLHITSLEHLESQYDSVVYPVGDLCDSGITLEALKATLMHAAGCDADAPNWDSRTDLGSVTFAGESLVVRQTAKVHREIVLLLTAIRKPGRQTFITTDTPNYEVLADAMQKKHHVEFTNCPLELFVPALERMTHVPIRLDKKSIKEQKVDLPTDTTDLVYQNMLLSDVLQIGLAKFKLSPQIRRNRIEIVSNENPSRNLQTALYDIRDICQSQVDIDAIELILKQLGGDSVWSELGGSGSWSFPKPGLLVVCAEPQTQVHTEILKFLTDYRASLTKPGQTVGDKPTDSTVSTNYYRLPTNLAKELLTLIPELVEPASWQIAPDPTQVGYIRLTPSIAGPARHSSTPTPDYSVLIIRHNRSVHQKIHSVILGCTTGDPRDIHERGYDNGKSGAYVDPYRDTLAPPLNR